ncbi:MAG: hypothetical protein ABIG90_02225 [bacterium]
MRKAFLILIPILLWSLYWGNLKPYFASRATSKAGPEKALSYNTFVNHEIRKVMANFAIESDNPEYVLFVTREMEQNIKERPLDTKSYILLSYLYYRLGWDDKFQQASHKALELAPNRQDVKDLQKLIKS